MLLSLLKVSHFFCPYRNYFDFVSMFLVTHFQWHGIHIELQNIPQSGNKFEIELMLLLAISIERFEPFPDN